MKLLEDRERCAIEAGAERRRMRNPIEPHVGRWRRTATAQVIKETGQVLLGAGILLIFVGYGGVYMQEGAAALQAILSRIWNYVAVILTLAPGAALIGIGSKMEKRQKR